MEDTLALHRLGVRNQAVMTVDMDSLEHPEHARSVGAERVCLQALEDLGLKDTLIQAGAKERDARLAVALVVARMLHPNSDFGNQPWPKGG